MRIPSLGASRRRPGPGALFLFAPLLFAFAARAQETAPLSVEEVVARSERAELVRALDLGRELGKAARENAGVREEIAQALATAAPMARLALGAALAEAGDANPAKDALLPLLDAGIPEPVAEAAATLVGLPPFRSEPASAKEISKALLGRLEAASLPPIVRLRAATSLFLVGGGAEKTRARSELRAFLRSEEENLRAEGALALASLGDREFPREELKRLAAEPSARGQLARTYLEREATERYYDRLLQKQREYYDKEANARPSKPFDAGDPQVLEEIMRDVREFHVHGDQFSREELVAAAARGMLNLLDPHSTFFTGEEFRRFAFDLKPEYGGIGAFVRTIAGIFTIVRPIYPGPAAEIGLRSGDRVFSVDGWDTRGHGEDEVIKRLKGKPGTRVKVKVLRQGWPEPREFEITRAEISVPVLHSELFPGGVGYVELVGFAENSAPELDRALDDLKRRGMKGLILDLRNNEGGLLKSAIEVASRFLPKGKKIVSTEGTRDGKEEHFSQGKLAVPESFPLVVLANEFSASASEIVAGALQDHGRAKIVGEPTYGKGSVQQLIPLHSLPDEQFQDENGNEIYEEWEKSKDNVIPNGKHDFGPRIKLTVARYLLPSGRSIHTETDKQGRVVQPGGIFPDETVEFARIPAWKAEELDRLLGERPEEGAFRKYVEEHFEANRELFVRLAEGDGGDPSLYPDFDSFYASLKTPLDRDEIRRWVRLRVREVVADDRKKVFPGTMFLGDYEEDAQLQHAIKLLLSQFGTDVNSVEEYRVVFAKTSRSADAPWKAPGGEGSGQPR
ncbi:MAG TPA: S41 family peptidase [Planctomycetota bacterium]|jgi:C-terminal peptidase prc|nr:S41 family peptidase [Planctomycetota bacterium]